MTSVCFVGQKRNPRELAPNCSDQILKVERSTYYPPAPTEDTFSLAAHFACFINAMRITDEEVFMDFVRSVTE